MYLQEFKIYLIGGHVLKAAEEVTIPAEHRLLNRFKKAKPDDILSVGSEETSQACFFGKWHFLFTLGFCLRKAG